MTEFELILADALREEAEEISMTTDQQRAAEELRTRLDHSDSRRRVWYVAAAVAVVVGVIVIFVAVRPTGDSSGGQIAKNPPSSSSPSSPKAAPFTASSLTPPVTLELPLWVEGAEQDVSETGAASFLEERGCAGLDGADPCAADVDLKLRLVSVRYFYAPDAAPRVITDPSYAAYVAHLDELGPLGVATISDRSELEVGGRPATVMTLSVLRDAPGTIACVSGTQPADECMPLIAGRAARIVVVNHGSDNPPTIFYLSLNGDAPDQAERFAEFDTMVDSATFG